MRRLKRLSKQHWIYLGIAALSVATFLVSSELDLVDGFYEFSRTHENWELDEVAILLVNGIMALSTFLYFRSKELRQALRERDKAEQNMLQMARHDALTGLYNRRAFLDHLIEVAGADSRRKAEVILMMLDLDRFKAVNDLHGHNCGDSVLMDVAARLHDALGDEDSLARLGGDEFAIALAPGSSVARAERIAHKLCTEIAKPFYYREITASIGTCIGLATVDMSTSYSDGLGFADHALYVAKAKGRGQFAWYDARLDAAAKERLQIEAELRSAISEGEVVPHFQPIFNIKTQELCGFEVLARWKSDSRGEIPPSTFICIAEDTGLIAPLGWTILRQACETARNWPAHLKVSVNFSPTQFQDPHLVERVASILEETGFDPARLDIEITESAFMKDLELAKRSIERLHMMGVSLSLDDFGTGYSSLSYLRQLPFDRIKIDRSFVSGIQTNAENQKLVTGILSLAQGLSLDVTAEGIETSGELDFLQAADCQLGQGFVFAQAISASEVDWMLETKWASPAPDTSAPDTLGVRKAG